MEGTNAIRFALRNWDKDSLLRAWFDHFDDDRNGFLEKDDFLLVSDQITRSDPYELWAALDYDKTGYVSLREISEEDARLWFDFKAWSGANFSGLRDMMVRILGTGAEERKPKTRSKLFGFRPPQAEAALFDGGALQELAPVPLPCLLSRQAMKNFAL